MFSKGDKRRYDLAEPGSATESAALMDVYLRLELTSEVERCAGKPLLERIARDAGETRAKLRRPMNSGSVTGSDAHTGYAPYTRSEEGSTTMANTSIDRCCHFSMASTSATKSRGRNSLDRALVTGAYGFACTTGAGSSCLAGSPDRQR